MGLKRLFLTSAAVSTATALCNFLGTILIVRWFGAGVYADYLVDLVYLSLLMILLEAVPSNYSIFRVQDEPGWLGGLAALSVVSAGVLAFIAWLSGSVFQLFMAYSAWIPPYAALLAVKRYLDIRLQSSGRLQSFLGIELTSGALRLLFLMVGFWLRLSPVEVVWASLACGTLLAQLAWFARNRPEHLVFLPMCTGSAWAPLFAERRNYPPYYLGITLKRMRDNIVPIIANHFFASREALGVFFLAYRGVSFTLGQIRIVEGLLSHRHTLQKVMSVPMLHRIAVALSGQLLCLGASVALLVMSGIEVTRFETLLLLSCIVWFYVFSLMERSKAYANFDAGSVNASLLAYCLVASAASAAAMSAGVRSDTVYAAVLVCADAASLLTYFLFSRNRRRLHEASC